MTHRALRVHAGDHEWHVHIRMHAGDCDALSSTYQIVRPLGSRCGCELQHTHLCSCRDLRLKEWKEPFELDEEEEELNEPALPPAAALPPAPPVLLTLKRPFQSHFSSVAQLCLTLATKDSMSSLQRMGFQPAHASELQEGYSLSEQ